MAEGDAAAPYRRGMNDALARRKCIAALVTELPDEVAVLVFDSRGAYRDREDRRTIRRTLERTKQLDSVTYTHRGSLDEMLLALPDAIGWAIGAGGWFTRDVRDRVQQIFLGEPG